MEQSSVDKLQTLLCCDVCDITLSVQFHKAG